MTQKIKVTPYVDLTSRMSGTTCDWLWEVEAVYVNGASHAFTWSDGVLTVTGYTAGVVLAEFTLYLCYDTPSHYAPMDPTDPDSAEVFWENRLAQFFSVQSAIKSFETGLTEVTGGSIGIRIDTEWLPLINELIIFSNRVIRIYTDDVISFKGITTQMSKSDYQLNVQVQKRITIIESELSWGDPAYLNRIDRSSNTSYYNGANVPADYQGAVIPMLFGDNTPYEAADGGEIDLGAPSPTFLVPPGTKRPSRGVSTSSHIVKVIPTGSSSGILGRMPNFQSISSVPISQTLTGAQHVFANAEQGSNTVILTKLIKGQVCTLERTTGTTIINSARYYGNNSAVTRGLFVLGAEDTTYSNYDTIKDCDENLHFFPTAIPTTSWTSPAVLSGTFTPAGHKWLTISGLTGVDLTNDELYCVITSISGEKTAVEILRFALESHGFSVDASSFTALASDLPYKTIQMAGKDDDMPTLGQFIAEINKSLLTVLVFPASNDEPFLIKVDPNKAASQTIEEYQIDGLSITDEYRDQAKTVEYRPKYAKSDAQKSALFVRQNSSMGTLFGSEKTISIDHVLDSVPTARWQEMTEFFGSPTSTVTFTLLDDDVEIELADCVQLDHPACSKKILVTSITRQPIGRKIQGRYLYVNNNS